MLHTYLKQAYRKEDLTQQSLSHEKWYEPDVVKLCTALNSTLLELLTAVCSPRNSVHEQVNEFEVEEGEELGEEERERQGLLKEGMARIVELNVQFQATRADGKVVPLGDFESMMVNI